jgi:hypothetical protein
MNLGREKIGRPSSFQDSFFSFLQFNMIREGHQVGKRVWSMSRESRSRSNLVEAAGGFSLTQQMTEAYNAVKRLNLYSTTLQSCHCEESPDGRATKQFQLRLLRSATIFRLVTVIQSSFDVLRGS